MSLQRMKCATRNDALLSRLELPGEPRFFLVPVGNWIIDDETLLGLMTHWRAINREMYFSRFTETVESMRSYLNRVSIGDPSAILFIIEDQSGLPHGHIGLKNVRGRAAEIDSVVRSVESKVANLMGRALTALLAFCEDSLDIETFTLEVISYNYRAIDFYQRNGFREVEKRPLFQSRQKDALIHTKVTTEAANVGYFSLKFAYNARGVES